MKSHLHDICFLCFNVQHNDICSLFFGFLFTGIETFGHDTIYNIAAGSVIKCDDLTYISRRTRPSLMRFIFRNMSALPIHVFSLKTDHSLPATRRHQWQNLGQLWSVALMQPPGFNSLTVNLIQLEYCIFGYGKQCLNLKSQIIKFHTLRFIRNHDRT